MRTSEKIRIEKALVTIGEIINLENVNIWHDLNQTVIAKNDADGVGDEDQAKKLLKRAKHLKSRAAEVADIIDAINELDRVFHRTF